MSLYFVELDAPHYTIGVVAEDVATGKAAIRAKVDWLYPSRDEAWLEQALEDCFVAEVELHRPIVR